MIILIVVFVGFLFCLFYWLLYSSDSNERKWISSPPPPPQQNIRDNDKLEKFSFETNFINENVTITTSQNNNHKDTWTFKLDSKYMFDPFGGDGDTSSPIIHEKDGCFGKPNGFKIKATGEKLYDHLHGRGGGFHIEHSSTSIHAREYLQKGLQFYFQCQNNKIHDTVYTCQPGNIFIDGGGGCDPVNICTDKQDGTLFPDFTNREYYLECQNEKTIRKRCQPETFFLMDSCRSLTNTKNLSLDDDVVKNMFCKPGIVFPLTTKKYIRCLQQQQQQKNDNNNNNEDEYTIVIENCPDKTSILPSWDQCYPDNCISKPDGFKTPMPQEIFLKYFQFHPGYYVCQDQKIVETVQCPSDWDHQSSKGEDNLTQLPMVFNPKTFKCVLPSLCDTVQTLKNVNNDEVVVVAPVHEFTKYLLSWKYSTLFDSVQGYRCDNQGNKIRFQVEPGFWIKDFRITSACQLHNNTNNNNHNRSGYWTPKVPIGYNFISFFDCQEQKIITCPKNHIFNGVDCVSTLSKKTHSFKNVPIFKFDDRNLSKHNNWMIPWIKKNPTPKVSCQDNVREKTYIFNYDICSDPDCAIYPFLSQIQNFNIFLTSRNEEYMCIYRNGKIQKKKNPDYYNNKQQKLNFWAQRYVPEISSLNHHQQQENCIPGQKTSSGNFVFDSTMYATCNESQPFVFCPSPLTKGIKKLKNSNLYACVPKEMVYSTEIPADTTVTFSVYEIHSILPRVGAQFIINGGKEVTFDGTLAIPISPRTVGKTIVFWSNQIALINYRNLVTYPVNAYLKNGQLVSDEDTTTTIEGRHQKAYDLQIDQYANYPMFFPKYNIVYF